MASCGLNPQNADFDLNQTLPEAKVTIYQEAIDKLGLMTSIYSAEPMKIMSKNIGDNTGTAQGTQFEIPQDITEMVKSTLNAIGGNVQYIPYDPEFVINSASTGYTPNQGNFDNKILPQVILSGGITEFDRGLVTKGDSLEFEVEVGSEYGLNFADQNKASLSSLTLDFNLIDFNTLTGIPRMQAVNGIKLHKGLKEDSIGFTVKSATFGAKGEIKKVEGRHAAVRLLVQLSMVQMIGRYQKLPYWTLVPGASRDPVVIDRVEEEFFAMAQPQRIAKVQELLYLHGYPVNPTGQLDSSTQSALQDFGSKHKVSAANIDKDVYLALFESVPITAENRQRRKSMGTLDMAALSPGISMPPPENTFRNIPSTTTVDSSDSGGVLTLNTNKSEFKIGETLSINFSVSDPMYVRIVLINSAGEQSTVFPNPYQSDSYCKPGTTYTIPPAGADFTLDIGEPAGTDRLRAVASRKPIPAEALYFTADGQFDDTRMAQYQVRASADYVIR